MMQFLRKHFKSNSGDSNVSKMTWVALVFVVGAILLVLITSAFRNPINRWFDKVQASWFADENGMFEADSAFPGYQKNENGTYKGLQYVYTQASGHRIVLTAPEEMENGYTSRFEYNIYKPDGQYLGNTGHGSTITISSDGTTIYDSANGWEFKAELPQ